jgi:NAD(P)-dependent dehydrogenase (short-subunit alcohol dehydrogenase family)
VTSQSDVDSAAAATIERFGRIDVLVNNAGANPYPGASEEVGLAVYRAVTELNLFGPIRICNAFLPTFRRQGSGHIVNVSSICGFTCSIPTNGAYVTSKHGLVGYSKTIRTELQPLGIRVTVVAPAAFRTAFGNRFSEPPPPPKPIVEFTDYDFIHEFREKSNQQLGKQRGDPDRGAVVIIDAVEGAESPFRLFLGPDAVELELNEIQEVQSDIEKYRVKSCGTNFPQDP